MRSFVPTSGLRMHRQTVIWSDRVLFRTNHPADMVFTQSLMLPYIGDGSPMAQSGVVPGKVGRARWG